jgi:hypothetical protein
MAGGGGLGGQVILAQRPPPSSGMLVTQGAFPEATNAAGAEPSPGLSACFLVVGGEGSWVQDA